MKQFHRHTFVRYQTCWTCRQKKVRHGRTVFSGRIPHLTYHMGWLECLPEPQASSSLAERGPPSLATLRVICPGPHRAQKATAWKASFPPATRPCSSHLLFPKALVRPKPTCLLAIFTTVTLLGSSEPGNDIPKNVFMKWPSSFRTPQNCIFILCLQKDLYLTFPKFTMSTKSSLGFGLTLFFFKYWRLGTSDYEFLLPFENHPG